MHSVPDLDSRLRAAATYWHLIVGEKLTGGTASAVYEAWDHAGRDLVLKIPQAVGGGGRAAANEAAALRVWQRTGAAVQLVATTDEALLLIRARPGDLMSWDPSASLTEVVDVAAELLGRLWSAPFDRHPYPTLAETYLRDEQAAREDAKHEQGERGEPERGLSGLVRLPGAKAAADALIQSTDVSTLLHGDFISKNLVADASSPIGWVALDPLPAIGDRAADVAAFAAYQPAQLILPIAEALAVQVGVSPERALAWTAIKTIHQAAQAWRDDQQHLEELVGSKTISRLLRSASQ